MKPFILMAIIVFGLSAAAEMNCSPYQLDEDEFAVGPYTVVVQDDQGSIYIGDGGLAVDSEERSGAEAMAEAVRLCGEIDFRN